MPIRLRDQSVYLGRAESTLANFSPNFDGSFVGVGTFTGTLARQLQPFTGAMVGQYQSVSLKTGTIGVTLQNASAAIVGATADTVAPPAPSAPTIDAFTSTSITIRFPTSSAPDHASWNVWRSPEGNFWTQIATGVTAATYTNSGLTASTTYYYALVDVDYSSNASPLGASVSQETSSSAGYSPGSPIFFDDFDYVVTNDIGDATANLAAFVAAGWENAASDNITGGRGGNLYTAVPADVPGHSGAFPGSTQRALVINSNAGTLGTQTDFWLEYGSTIGDIPANVYFQFWVYVARSGAQMSAFHGREKFIYPTRNTYPATSGNNGGHWLFELSTNSYPPDSVDVAATGQAFSLLRDSTISSSTPYYDNQDAINNGITASLGQNLSTSPLFAPNQWVEVRLHFDTSTATGTHEAWRRVVGEDWVKVTEWISGTPVAGDDFTWNIDASFRDGHQTIRMPTTMPANNASGTVNSWIYMQDFAIADDVNDLPTYEGY